MQWRRWRPWRPSPPSPPPTTIPAGLAAKLEMGDTLPSQAAIPQPSAAIPAELVGMEAVAEMGPPRIYATAVNSTMTANGCYKKMLAACEAAQRRVDCRRI